MDNEIKSISEVQDAEHDANMLLERALSKKQKRIEDANSRAREMIEEAESNSKEMLKQSLEAAQKQLESAASAEMKVTHKMVGGIKKRKLSLAKTKQIAEEVARVIAGE
ncbi:MAG: hypothetical protein ACREBF_02565 [Candidatus Micrarchaeales archaeon]